MNRDKRIWLINMGDEIVWCDVPDPSHDCEEEDATEYVLIDEYRAVEVERDKALKGLNDAAAYLQNDRYTTRVKNALSVIFETLNEMRQ
jgi:hypothetical protein